MHAILEGEAHLWADDPEGAVRVSPGDVMLVREDTEHHLARASGAPTESLNSVITAGLGVSRQITVGHPPGRWRNQARQLESVPAAS